MHGRDTEEGDEARICGQVVRFAVAPLVFGKMSLNGGVTILFVRARKCGQFFDHLVSLALVVHAEGLEREGGRKGSGKRSENLAGRAGVAGI